jgi:hypothetical protein
MLYAYVQTFDVTENLKKIWKLNMTSVAKKWGLIGSNWHVAIGTSVE